MWLNVRRNVRENPFWCVWQRTDAFLQTSNISQAVSMAFTRVGLGQNLAGKDAIF